MTAARHGAAARTRPLYSVSVQKTRVPDHALVQLRRARDHADRHFAEPLDLEQLASVAALSKYHFHRLFTATYGQTPAAHLSERRIERAQDLLRSTNLTVTEVCFAVGFNSLGSFSSRFTQIVGESPSGFQQRYAGNAPRIPGCYLFMSGYLERKIASEEKPATRTAS
jgi:transcriptional regulator GlxA family with amidase domain